MSVRLLEHWFSNRMSFSCEAEFRAVLRRMNRRRQIEGNRATEVEEIRRQNGWPSGETLVAEFETTVLPGG